jgi:hypothetical protein
MQSVNPSEKRARRKIPGDAEQSVLIKSARRCALCFHLSGDLSEREGQIAHLDHDPSNSGEENLVFLCLSHHSLYDSRTSQHKNYTIIEVKAARKKLYAAIAAAEHHKEGATVPEAAQTGLKRALTFVPHQMERPSWVTHIVKPVYRMVMKCRWVVTNVSSNVASVTNARLECPSAPGVVFLFGRKKGAFPGHVDTVPTLQLQPNEIGEVECTFAIQPPLHDPPQPVKATVILGDNFGDEYVFPNVLFIHEFPVSDSYMKAYFSRQEEPE